MTYIETAIRTLRSHLNPILKGPTWNALLAALAEGDGYLAKTARAASQQMFLSSSEGRYLDRHAANRNIPRPLNVGMGDDSFRELTIAITNNKLTLQSLKRVVAAFYGDPSTVAHATSVKGPFDLFDGATLHFDIDGQRVVVTFRISDFRSIGNASPLEVANAITRTLMLYGSSGYAVEHDGWVVIYSGAYGIGGSVRVIGGEAQDRLLFPLQLTDLSAAGIWTTTRRPGETTRFTYGGISSPTLQLRRGDVANVYGTAFLEENRGPHEILAAGSDWFEVKTSLFAPQSVAVGASAIKFYRPRLNTVYAIPNHALVAPVGNSVKVRLPATVPAVERHADTAAYLGEVQSFGVEFAQRMGGATIITTSEPHGLAANDLVFVDGVYPVFGDGKEGLRPAALAAELPLPYSGHQAVALKSGVLVVGEKGFHTYDPVSEKWTTVNEGTSSYTSHRLIALDDGRVLILGAKRGAALANEIYDPSANAVIRTADFVEMKSGKFSVSKLKDGRVFVYPSDKTDKCEIYDPPTGLFSLVPGRAEENQSSVATATLNDGRVFIVGSIQSEIFNPVNKAFTTVSTFARTGELYASLVPSLGADGKVLIMGGGLEQAFDPSTHTFSAISELEGMSGGVTGTAVLGDGRVLISRYSGSGGNVSCLWDPLTASTTMCHGASLKSVAVGGLSDGGAMVVGGEEPPSLRFYIPSVSSVAGFNGLVTVKAAISDTTFTYQSFLPDSYATPGVESSVVRNLASNGGVYAYDEDRGLSVVDASTSTTQSLGAGRTHGLVSVANATSFPDEAGLLVFGLGYEYETVCRYTFRPDSHTLTLDPSFVFPVSIPKGASVTKLAKRGSFVPKNPGKFGAFYSTDSTSPRIAVEGILDDAAAAGSNLDKQVFYPGDRGLGGEGLGVAGQSVSDKVIVWGGVDMDEESKKAKTYESF